VLHKNINKLSCLLRIKLVHKFIRRKKLFSSFLSLFFLIGLVAIIPLLNINLAYSQVEIKDRYQIECGMKLLITPDEYNRVMLETWNNNPDSMPPALKAQYDCVNRVHAEHQLGLQNSRNEYDNLDNQESVQDRADQILKELGGAITRNN
jgi:hypothetical protein